MTIMQWTTEWQGPQGAECRALVPSATLVVLPHTIGQERFRITRSKI
jgi:hypothetical protein